MLFYTAFWFMVFLSTWSKCYLPLDPTRRCGLMIVTCHSSCRGSTFPNISAQSLPPNLYQIIVNCGCSNWPNKINNRVASDFMRDEQWQIYMAPRGVHGAHLAWISNLNLVYKLNGIKILKFYSGHPLTLRLSFQSNIKTFNIKTELVINFGHKFSFFLAVAVIRYISLYISYNWNYSLCR